MLNRLDSDGNDLPDMPNATLVALGDALHQFLPPLRGNTLPILVLLGDVLELAFASRQEVTKGFLRFLERLYPENKADWIFSEKIVLVPGNHDHHLWNSEVDTHFLDLLDVTNLDSIDHGRLATTRIFSEPKLTSRFLTSLMKLTGRFENPEVTIKYPNFGLRSRDGKRCVILHHGHYVEPLYRLMSTASAWLDERSINGVDLAQLECENGPWVDFLWSSLGETGGFSSEVLHLYEIMQDTAAMHEATSEMTARIVRQLRDRLPMSGLPDMQLLATRLTKGMLDLSVGRASQMERSSYQEYLTKGTKAGLAWYLEHPVHKQILKELGEVPEEVRFVFGHTHKPFEDQIPLAFEKYKLPVHVYNTGGWVLDQPRMASAQGAAMVFIDQDCNVASLRLFNNTLNVQPSTVNVRDAIDDRTKNPLRTLLEEQVLLNKDVWETFSRKAHASLALRSQLMSRRFFDPRKQPGKEVGRN